MEKLKIKELYTIYFIRSALPWYRKATQGHNQKRRERPAGQCPGWIKKQKFSTEN